MNQRIIRGVTFQFHDDATIVANGRRITAERSDAPPAIGPGVDCVYLAKGKPDLAEFRAKFEDATSRAAASYLNRLWIIVAGAMATEGATETMAAILVDATSRPVEDIRVVCGPQDLDALNAIPDMALVDTVQCVARQREELDAIHNLERLRLSLDVLFLGLTPGNAAPALDKLFAIRDTAARSVDAAPASALPAQANATWMAAADWLAAFIHRTGGHLQYRCLPGIMEPLIALYYRRVHPDQLDTGADAALWLLHEWHGRVGGILAKWWDRNLPAGSIAKRHAAPSQDMTMPAPIALPLTDTQLAKVARNRALCLGCGWNGGFAAEPGQSAQSLSVCAACQCPRKQNRVSLYAGRCPLTPPKFIER